MAGLFWASPARAQETVVKESDTAQQTVWRIDQPDVDIPRKDYPMVTFRKYDEVIVTGGGCVHTRGSGQTWKRYINPSGNNSDRLYHGRISIPGATAELVRISSIEGQHLVVNKFPAHADDAPVFLQLGYEDDDYALNDYSDHDDGNNKQCALSKDPEAKNGKAYLIITIIHHGDSATAPPTPMPRAPFDLWWQEVDENSLPYNPDWWLHIPNSKDKDKCDQFREGAHDFLKLGKSPKCTMWDPDVDEANTGTSFCHFLSLLANSVHGHINWANVTYRGTVYFDVANNKFGDGDYDWWFSPQNMERKAIENGSSTANPVHAEVGKRTLAMEFSSRETVDQINQSGSWWETFHTAVDGGVASARKLVNGKEAIVIGLIGFDNEHANKPEGARVELHPVYVLAIHIVTESENYWTILARNWGNEGSCANGWDITGGKWLHYLGLPENKIKLFLPFQQGSANVIDEAKTRFHTNGGAAKYSTKEFSDGVLFTIELPEPEQKRLFWGELYLKK
ncbi:MAG: hypothetical protein QOD75_2202 [Blastocatellia bacterium]|nr:hypothetical protein [Blastocatellia bacterium]